MCHAAVLDCGTGALAPASGRHFVLEQLDACFGPQLPGVDARWDIALVATELLTNAARAAQDMVRFEVAVHRSWVELAVTDDGPGNPRVRHAAPLDTSGRGLSIVDSLAMEWGVRMSDASTDSRASGAPSVDGSLKTVWVRLSIVEDRADALICTK